MVTAATIYLSLVGSEGLRRTALQCHANTKLLIDKLTALEGMVRADNSLPPEGVAALQAIATDGTADRGGPDTVAADP